MDTAPVYKSVVSLIPGGGLQFLDFEFRSEPFSRLRRHFFEELRPADRDQEGRQPHDLICLLPSEDGFLDPRDESEWTKGESYQIKGEKGLESFLDEWVPVPFLRVKASHWQDGEPRHERGPTNWVRARVVRTGEEEEQRTYRLVLAFDTSVEDRPPEREPYFALSREDVEEHASFRLAHRDRDNHWFLDLGWVEDWIKAVYQKHNPVRRRRGQVEEEEFVCLHLAHYLTFLDVLRTAIRFPALRVINPVQNQPTEVDLVLDLGNARSAGILVETSSQRATNLNDSYLLEIRDLSRPWQTYSEPFETRVEFAEASFGSQVQSARSGRQSDAFVWASAVRVGPEASWLAARSRASEGDTGMSSPKRYLWDQRTREQQWRYNILSVDEEEVAEPPVTRGAFVQYVNKEGTPLEVFERRGGLARHKWLKSQSREVAFEARYTRSSIMMFLLSEIILHALTTINSPAQRCSRQHSDIPRRLRRVIFTMSNAMPLAEQNIYRRWAELAVDMVWRCLGWEQDSELAEAQGGLYPFQSPPTVRAQWDEATCTHLVYLYNELSEKYQGDIHHLFRLLGRQREGYGQSPSVRVASIDIGGGTTDLSIATYEAMGDESTTARMRPHLDFRDGFNIAGDDMLARVVENHFLQDLRAALVSAGVPDARGLLSHLFGGDTPGQAITARNLRTQFARQVATPVCLALLQEYEDVDIKAGNRVYTRPLREFFAEGSGPARRCLAYVEDAVRAAGGAGFQLMDMPVNFNAHAMDYTVKEELGRVMADLCEVIHLYGCDLLLLTGRPSRWPAVLSAVLAKLPVMPDRVIPMHDFRVGRWYPFADEFGHIRDPKTTVVVGAILLALAEGHLEGFSFDTTHVRLKPTARFIGEMNKDGQIKSSKVWFQVDVDSPAEQELSRVVEFSTTVPIGFRQLEAERWPTTRFYQLEFAGQRAREEARGRLPYQVKVVYAQEELDPEEDPDAVARDEGELYIDEVTDAEGDSLSPNRLDLRLQTLPSEEGYWLDTGIFNIA